MSSKPCKFSGLRQCPFRFLPKQFHVSIHRCVYRESERPSQATKSDKTIRALGSEQIYIDPLTRKNSEKSDADKLRRKWEAGGALSTLQLIEAYPGRGCPPFSCLVASISSPSKYRKWRINYHRSYSKDVTPLNQVAESIQLSAARQSSASNNTTRRNEACARGKKKGNVN